MTHYHTNKYHNRIFLRNSIQKVFFSIWDIVGKFWGQFNFEIKVLKTKKKGSPQLNVKKLFFPIFFYYGAPFRN